MFLIRRKTPKSRFKVYTDTTDGTKDDEPSNLSTNNETEESGNNDTGDQIKICLF